MYKTILLLLVTTLTLLAYSDRDMDGVDDKLDQCPNTQFSDLVDISGCTVKNLKSQHHFDIIYGINFSQANYAETDKTDTTTQSLQLDYYYKNFSIQITDSYYDYSNTTVADSGLNDAFIGAFYKLPSSNNLSVRVGAGAILPTYNTALNNNNTDYTASVNLSYKLKNINLFGGYSYTLVNDDDIPDVVSYQNTSSISAGVGFYPLKDVYLSCAYNASDSIYKSIQNIRTASAYVFYNINTHWFTSFSYAYGLSDSASNSSTSLRVGYFF